MFLPILCSIKIEWLLFLKFLKNLAFFDSYFWPFNKSEEKIKVIFVNSAIMPSIWNVFIKFCSHDEKLTKVSPLMPLHSRFNNEERTDEWGLLDKHTNFVFWDNFPSEDKQIIKDKHSFVQGFCVLNPYLVIVSSFKANPVYLIKLRQP